MAEIRYLAPAKINLSLQVRRPDPSGFHPLRSLVQALDFFDVLDIDAGDEDVLEIVGADLPDGGDNLVWKAVAALGADRPQLAFTLRKAIPVAAGLGGGSSDAAATLRGVAELLAMSDETVLEAAPKVGADVPFFLTGGTALMEGYGERIKALDALSGFAVAVAVPPFELPTPEVYRRWDRLDSPVGPEFPSRGLPPSLRREGPFRNDLLPAAVAVAPALSDWMRDLAEIWDRPVAMSGSGPSVFGYFADHDEASAAAREVPSDVRAAFASDLSRLGVRRDR
jgi:4-diphosphocytidyl-2-C-methyl-D-erythritol kinase